MILHFIHIIIRFWSCLTSSQKVLRNTIFYFFYIRKFTENFMQRKTTFCLMQIGITNYIGTDNETVATEACN